MTESRRPLKSRELGLLQSFAALLARSSITPNQISTASIVIALVGALVLVGGDSPYRYLFVALTIQLRLLCNVVDGLVAVEGGKKTALGAMYNEFPDRIADTLFIVAAGYAIGHGWLGWSGALVAMATAYIRAFGASQGFGEDFGGPMAKPHRMFVLTVGCVAATFQVVNPGMANAMLIALGVILVGSAVTCVRRTQTLVTKLTTRATDA